MPQDSNLYDSKTLSQAYSNGGQFVDFPTPPVVSLPMALRWRVERLAPEDVIQGWIAGPCVRVTTHWTGKATKPCRTLMTDGKLECHCQTHRIAKRVTGYMPIIAKDGDRCVLVVSDTLALKVQRIPHATTVTVTRPRNPTSAFKVKQENADALSSTMARKVQAAGPQDIKPFLLHLWQDPELTVHFAAEFYPSIATVHKPQSEEAA